MMNDYSYESVVKDVWGNDFIVTGRKQYDARIGKWFVAIYKDDDLMFNGYSNGDVLQHMEAVIKEWQDKQLFTVNVMYPSLKMGDW